MKVLRTFAALFSVLFIALCPLLFASTSEASTLEDYNAQLALVQQAVSDAQALLSSAQIKLANDQETATVAVQESATAASALATAQNNYDTQLIEQIVSTGSGLTVKVYNNTISMTPNESNLCRTTSVTEIAANWGGGPVLGCNSDRVTVHYYGTLTVPQTTSYQFKNIADDGFYMTLNNQVVINNWYDKGCGGNWGTPITLTAGTAYALDAWFYENGGGACSTLYYQTSTNWAQVPASWFGSETSTVMVKDPALLAVLQSAQSTYNAKVLAVTAANNVLSEDSANISKLQNDLSAAISARDSFPARVLNAPTNLLVTLDTATVHLSWDAPESNTAVVERYAVSWSTDNFHSNGWGVASTTTSIDLSLDIFSTRGVANQFTIRADNDTLHVYSTNSSSVEVVLPAIPSTTPETSTVVPETTTVQETYTVTETTTVQETVTVVETQTVVETVIVPPPAPPVVEPTPPPVPVISPIPAPETRPVTPEPQLPAPPPTPDPTPDPVEETNQESDPVVEEPPSEPPTPPVEEPSTDPVPVPEDPAPGPSVDPTPTDSPDVSSEPDTPVDDVPLEPTIIEDPATTLTTTDEVAPEASPEEYLSPKEVAAYKDLGLIPNNPDQLPDTVPKLPDPIKDAALLQPHVQVDVAGVENGGITFFGTKTAPQVVGEDGQLTPPAPPPGSGLPIPPDAITTEDTFIGQPGGTTFNAPDIAVPVILTPLDGAIASIPGAEALNEAFVAMANIGNDMSPITRKKAKKILIATIVAGQISQLRKRF